MYATQKFQRSSWFLATLAIVIALGMGANMSMASDYGALTNGTWSNASIWTPAGVPGGGDNAYIGSTYPNLSASTASVTLAGPQSVNNLLLGYNGALNSGTLNLGSYQLTVNSGIYIGLYGGSGTIVEGGGSFSTPNLYIDSGNSLALSAADTVTNSITLLNNSALTLAAPTTISGIFDVESHATLDMANNPLTASQVILGWYSQQPITILNRAPITTTNLTVDAQTFNLNPLDNVTNCTLYSASSTLNSSVYSLTLNSTSHATTTAPGSVTGNVSINENSTLTLGAPMTLSGALTIDPTATLDMAGNSLSAYSASFSTPLLGRAPITVTNLSVSNLPFDLNPTDNVTNFSLSSGTSTLNSPVSSLSLDYSSYATTTPAGSIGASITLRDSSTLTLGSATTLSGNLDVESYATLNMANNPLSASTVYLGWNSDQPITILNRAPITATSLNVAYQTFNLNPSDNVTYYTLWTASSTLNSSVASLTLYYSSNATTTALGGVTGNVNLNNNSTLTLGAPMTLSGALTVDPTSTLDMAGNSLNAYSVSFSTPLLGRATITATNLSVSNLPFDLNPTDNVTNFSLSSGTSTLYSPVSTLTIDYSSYATTTPAGSVGGSITLRNSSTLTLGSATTLSGNLDVESYATLDMANNPLSAATVYLGWNSDQPITILNRAPITATSLNVAYQTFNLNPSDNVTYYTLWTASSTLNSSVASLTLYYSSNATTTALGGVTGSVNLNNNSTLTLGAPMTLSGNLTVDPTSTLDMAGNSLNAYSVSFSTPLLGRAPITATYLSVSNLPFDLNPTDNVTNFSLSSGTSTLYSPVSTLTIDYSSYATTTPAGSVGSAITLRNNSTLNLESATTLSGNLDVESNATLNMENNPLTASTVYLGWNSDQPITILNRAPITATSLYVANQTFNLNPSDNVTYYTLWTASSTLGSSVSSLTLYYSSNATTTAPGNVTGNVNLYNGSTLTLGSPMTLGGNLTVADGSTLDAQHQPISAPGVYVGQSGAPASLVNGGTVTTNYLSVTNASSATIGPDSVVGQISLDPGSLLRLLQSSGQTTGLTLTGADSSDLSITGGSTLDLQAGANGVPGWVFRWADPAGGDWVSTLNNLIGSGEITVEAPAGYTVVNDPVGGYTYIDAAAVPEPASLALLAAGAIGLLVWRRKRAAK